jgi:hypothetical protein
VQHEEGGVRDMTNEDNIIPFPTNISGLDDDTLFDNSIIALSSLFSACNDEGKKKIIIGLSLIYRQVMCYASNRVDMSTKNPMTLDELHRWHTQQSRNRQNTHEGQLFHIRASTLLSGISNAVGALSKTMNGEEQGNG